MKEMHYKNKLQLKSFVSGITFFFKRDFILVAKKSYIEIILTNLVICICLDYFQFAFSFIYRISVLIHMLSVMFFYAVIMRKSSKTNKFTDLQKSEINSEYLTQVWSKRNQMVIKILLILIPYFIQLYFQLNIQLFTFEPILAATSNETMQGCIMYLIAALLIYFAYQSQLFKIAYENKMREFELY